MKTFEEIKQEILSRGKEAGACTEQYLKALKTNNLNELIVVIKDNMEWLLDNEVIDTEFLDEYFEVETLNENHIYTSGKHFIKVVEGEIHIFILSSSSVIVNTFNGSIANIKTFNSSAANVQAWGRSSVNVETCHSSKVNVKTYDVSYVNVETCDCSSANVKTWGYSTANVNTCHDSTTNVETWSSSSANVKIWNSSSKLTFKVKSSDSFIRHHNERKIYVKKNSFEIEEVE